MSRRSRRQKAQAAAAAPTSQMQTLSVPVSVFGGGSTGYQGAHWSTNRGYIYWPTLDPTRELNQPTRRELARRIHFLCANVGLPNRMIAGIRNMVIGVGMVPKAMTRDRTWNQLATKNYENRASSKLSYDVTGKFSGWEMQRKAYDTRLKDADAAIVYTKSAAGRTLRKLYSGLRIGNATTGEIDQEQWIDGVKLDALERAAYYRFLTQQGKRSRDISAADMTFLASYPESGSIRGEPLLKHAANKIIDITEIHTSWLQQIKNSASIGYYLASTTSPATGGDMVEAAMKRINGPKRQVDGPNGEKITLKVVMGNGNEIVELPPGYDIKTLLDQRPHTNQKEFLDEIIRDISWGCGLSFDLLWNIYKLGGANTRYVLSDAQTFVEVEQDSLVYSWLIRDYVQETADAIAAGALPPCQDPEWWQHGWVPPARQTVDFGRDGRIYLEEYARGLITTERYFALKGQDAREEFIAECDFAEFRREEMKRRGLTETDFAYLGNRQNAPAAVEPEKDEKGEKDSTTEEEEDSEKKDDERNS